MLSARTASFQTEVPEKVTQTRSFRASKGDKDPLVLNTTQRVQVPNISRGFWLQKPGLQWFLRLAHSNIGYVDPLGYPCAIGPGAPQEPRLPIQGLCACDLHGFLWSYCSSGGLRWLTSWRKSIQRLFSCSLDSATRFGRLLVPCSRAD